MTKNFVRFLSVFVFVIATLIRITTEDVLMAIYYLLMALYLIHVSETL